MAFDTLTGVGGIDGYLIAARSDGGLGRGRGNEIGGVCEASKALPQAPGDVAPGSITYEDIPYPYPVKFLPLTLYGQDVRMAYMDIPPAGAANGRVVVLLHGMNFGGFYFAGPIKALRKEGFRVVVPDQIGFGRSSKPIIPYNSIR
jgi:pimeloyl-ACP methyl ester carboxylesterase